MAKKKRKSNMQKRRTDDPFFILGFNEKKFLRLQEQIFAAHAANDENQFAELKANIEAIGGYVRFAEDGELRVGTPPTIAW